MTLGKHGKLFTAFSFLRLGGDDIVWYQWIYPTLLYIVVYPCLVFLSETYSVVDMENPVADITVLTGVLVGFYILVLVAICGMENESLDQAMKGRGPQLRIIRGGDQITEPLTRRRFVVVLFGYCAALSGLVWMFGVFVLHVGINHVDVFRVIDLAEFPGLAVILGWAFHAVYTWMLCSLLVVTLLGLHYLVERIHRP